ncbi:MAG TPA: rod shape-determining protein MreC [Candidatus Paceibacterota bacterium]|nr:rod shape-determining protein MreC [Candidatus Paceibacterota bacterium]HOK97398.1 rod shape-determining protein MreC [Candidatus Paceibacterota bacterium]HPP64915.1 rod shape-determining protein MreC [Candidatus Paceibacterota bacterium]
MAKKGKIKINKLLTKVIILITFVIIFKAYLGQKQFLENKTVQALGFVNQNVSFGGLSSLELWFSDLFHFNQIRRENLQLKTENLNLVQEINYLSSLREENELLKEALKIKEEQKWHLIPAKVILMDPTGLSGNFWINKGLDDNLKEGMNVITNNEVLVGRIVKCYNQSSEVESIFAPGIKISVEDLRSKVLAVTERDFQGNFYLRLVPPNADINVGDILVTSSENSSYLKGLVVARVKEKIPGSKIPEKEYILEPFLNRLKLQDVLIITDFFKF